MDNYRYTMAQHCNTIYYSDTINEKLQCFPLLCEKIQWMFLQFSYNSFIFGGVDHFLKFPSCELILLFAVLRYGIVIRSFLLHPRACSKHKSLKKGYSSNGKKVGSLFLVLSILTKLWEQLFRVHEVFWHFLCKL